MGGHSGCYVLLVQDQLKLRGTWIAVLTKSPAAEAAALKNVPLISSFFKKARNEEEEDGELFNASSPCTSSDAQPQLAAATVRER